MDTNKYITKFSGRHPMVERSDKFNSRYVGGVLVVI